MQWTGGYAPRFQAFSWLEVGSGKVALSRPTPSGYPLQGATQTRAVGQFFA
jgi:hypothetical protein